jgi:hypothetical protein
MLEKNSTIVFPRELLKSEPFRKLTKAGLQVLILLYCRRRMKWIKSSKYWKIINNGDIVLPYTEVQKRLRISRKTISRAFDQLIEYGFINIPHAGGGMNGDCSKYFISDRWEEYGAADFILKIREKDTRCKITPKNWEKIKKGNSQNVSNLDVKNVTAPSDKNQTALPNYNFDLESIEKGELNVNLFIKKGEMVLKALSLAKANQ